MKELDFLINLRALMLQAVRMVEKRIEFLRCIPIVQYDGEECKNSTQ